MYSSSTSQKYSFPYSKYINIQERIHVYVCKLTLVDKNQLIQLLEKESSDPVVKSSNK